MPRKGSVKDMTGLRFGRLTVVRHAGQNRHRMSVWECVCECGVTTRVVRPALVSGLTKSCGCLHDTHATTHGKSRNGTPEYRVWACMLSRCRNETDDGYHNYGGRGIKVCERWLSFENFMEDMGPRPSPKHSIDRKNNNGDYEPSNCRWATKKEQDRNRRTNRLIIFNGETKCITEWAEIYHIHPVTLTYRLEHGWSVERALTTPLAKGGKPWTNKPA